MSGGGSVYPTYRSSLIGGGGDYIAFPSVLGGESVQRNAMLGSDQFWGPPSRLRGGVQTVQGNMVFRSGGPHYASVSPLVPQRQLRLVGSFLDGGTIVQGLVPKLMTSPGTLLQAPVVSTPGFIRLAHTDGIPQYTEVPQEVSPSREQAPQRFGAPQYVEVRQGANPITSQEEPHYMEEGQVAPRYMDMPYYTAVRTAASPYAETPQYAEMRQAVPRYVEVSRYRDVRKATPLIFEEVRRAKDPHRMPVLLRNYGGLAREQSPLVYRESGSPLLQRVPIAIQGHVPVVTVTYHEPAPSPPPAKEHKIKEMEEREEERAVKDERRKSERQYKEMYKKIQGIARHIEQEVCQNECHVYPASGGIILSVSECIVYQRVWDHLQSV